MQETEIRCNAGECSRLVCKVSAGVLYVRGPRCGVWRAIPVSTLVEGMAQELACDHGRNGQPTKVFL